MCGVFRGGRMPPRKIPPAPRTRRNAPGAKAGCAFFAPGFFAQAKKGGSRRHGAKALDPDSAVAWREKSWRLAADPDQLTQDRTRLQCNAWKTSTESQTHHTA